MNNIFVNYNNSLALKEKGYNEPFFFYYRTDDEVKEVHHAMHTTALVYNQKTIDDEVVAAPIQQDVLIWLKDKKGIVMWVQPYTECENDIWPLWEYKIKAPNIWDLISVGSFESSEAAIDAGLEYIIKNLIK